MKKIPILYGLTFLLSFCSIVYELILAQTLSAFLANTVLRYSVTIGLYLFSLGMGSLLAEGKFFEKPGLHLIFIEIFLTLLGGFSVVFMFLLDGSRASFFIFSLLGHLFVVVIGVLSGFEVPLLIVFIGQQRDNKESLILGFNYLGAFCGTILFSFILYPYIGLVSAGFLVGLLNAVAGILLFFICPQSLSRKIFYLQCFLCFILILCLWHSNFLNEQLLRMYLR
ncbi:MAG TPA: hypothetical protein PLH56_03295 [Candidatus Omnitrophota bacterium]|nr:hypothetical protein [Candidatus Omnitrophota bacterium]HPN88340.1 hypothetical protein [Candidatus Omnitrophota bacterium]